MNRLGVSSSCFYPQPTEVSFEKICRSGVRTAELFLNADSELSPGFCRGIRDMQLAAGVDIISVHTFTGFADSFILFTDYERRFFDGIELYRRLASAAAGYGAKYVVMHGAKSYHTVPDAQLCERFAAVARAVREEGATLLYENVKEYRSASPEFLKMMTDAADGLAGTVLDVKQARRSAVPYARFIDLLGGAIKHVHISDFDEHFDCTPPLTGLLDFGELFERMRGVGYEGAYIIELYKKSYKSEDDILNSYKKLIEKYDFLC